MGTCWELDPGAEHSADHASFDPQEALVRVVTTANHLIVSQHIHEMEKMQ